MAKRKATRPANPASRSPTPTSRRPHNALFISIFIVLAITFAVLMRIDTTFRDVPLNFDEIIEAGRFVNGVPIVRRYTGINAIDFAAQFFVTVFLAGPLRWDPGVHVQQRHFLMNWFAMVCVWSVEACRRRNKWRLISFITLFAFLYQTVGACIMVPLYGAAYVYTSAQDAYHFQGREVPASYAKVLLPTAVLGYLVPTVALWYTPWNDSNAETVQYLTAFWQIAPLLASVLLFMCSFFVPSYSSIATKNGDVKYLKLVYLIAGLVSVAEHINMLYTCFTSDDRRLSLSYVFLPNRATWMDSMTLGLHYILQVDYWGTIIAVLFWCWIAIYDTMRILDKASAFPLIQTVLGLLFYTVVVGPGATLALVYSWREDRLVMIESGVKGTWKKSKST